MSIDIDPVHLKYAVEWFIAPLAMFIFLFKWRDELNILHMPWADLVAIIVVADVALALNSDRVPQFLLDLHNYSSPYNGNPVIWASLAIAGFFVCRFQVKVLEEDIERIAIDQLSVGWGHKQPYKNAQHLKRKAALTSDHWKKFTLCWAGSVALTVAIIAAHSVVIGMQLPAWGPSDAFWNEVAHVVALTLIAFVGAILLSALLVLADIFRIYPPKD